MKKKYNFNNLLKNAVPIKNKKFANYSSSLLKNLNINNLVKDKKLLNNFLNYYIEWLDKSTLNNLKNLKRFKYASYTHGASQAFDFFYSKYKNKNFRFFKGDFIYHQLSCRNNYKYEFLDNLKLKKNDAVIISLPFSDSGDKHNKMDEILVICEKKLIPVLIDCAYINLARDIHFDFSKYKCIEEITFSLSKPFFSLDRFRIGIRLKKNFDDDPIDVFNSYDMYNKIGAHLGLSFMNKFSPDENQILYYKKQQNICKEFGLLPSKSIIFGLGDNKYQSFNRGGNFNRVCISNLLGDKI